MNSEKISLSKPAFTTGISLIAMTILSFIIFPSLKANLYSIIGISIIIVLDIIVGLGLFYLLKPVNKNLAFIMSLLRIIYAVFFTIALYNIYSLEVFNTIWSNALVIFGLHLLFLGILIYKSKYIPKWLGILILIGALGYIIDSTAKQFGFNSQIGMFTFFGEPLLAIWLIIKAKKLKY
jgi:hypothetical protein